MRTTYVLGACTCPGEKDGQLEVYRAQRLLSRERKKAVDATREAQVFRDKCKTLESDLEGYREQRQEDLDALLKMDDLERIIAEERKVSKQSKREAEVWKEKFNESQENLELCQFKLSQPRSTKRAISEESFLDEDLFNFNSDDDEQTQDIARKATDTRASQSQSQSQSQSKFTLNPKSSLKHSLIMTGPRPTMPLPPPRKRFRAATPHPTLPVKEEDEECRPFQRRVSATSTRFEES
ncbi:hypothetical protein D9758_008017 [Tetrapyrgos nigripes]|uniref:Uncharacterized protein n=1 Tax=Tetrapyrgos nigripes TaxID=182062 RepID=A0A8H5D0B9_9AGAR|nr:hypothetical protein D9758_008017 [Tetrapyrgos nigripes]